MVAEESLTLTWEELVRRRSWLQYLEDRAILWPRWAGNQYCLYETWYGGGEREAIRDILTEQVGWLSVSNDPVLHTCEAYDVAYDHLFDLLPQPCARVGCCQWGRTSEDEPGPEFRQLGRKVLDRVRAGPRSSRRSPTREQWEFLRPYLTPAVLELSGYKCVICGCTQRLTVDHIVPIDQGGTNDIRNLRALCASCNSRKGAR